MPGNRSRSTATRRGCNSTATTRAPARTRCAVSAPWPAPRSRTSSPGRTPAAATTRAAHSSVSRCQPHARRDRPEAGTADHHHVATHAPKVARRGTGRQSVFHGRTDAGDMHARRARSAGADQTVGGWRQTWRMAADGPGVPGSDPVSSATALDGFSAATRAWFEGAFAVPTQAQAQAWRAIGGRDSGGEGADTLVIAPTGSGKTLAAFLWAIDRLAAAPPPADRKRRTRVLYVSPLKALAVDIERNLRSPLTGIRQAARRLGLPEPDIQVAVRTGDTAAEERRKIATRPPDILITTPESLFLLLTSQARETLRGVETVIVDEVHAVAGTKRGAHLALSLERLDALRTGDRAQRVGLSATVRPAAEVATFLGGARPVTVVQPASSKQMELEVIVPVEDLSALDSVQGADGEDDPARRRSIWPHVEERVLDLIEAHRSTIVFANSRRLAERLCGRLNELATERALARDEAAAGLDAPG